MPTDPVRLLFRPNSNTLTVSPHLTQLIIAILSSLLLVSLIPLSLTAIQAKSTANPVVFLSRPHRAAFDPGGGCDSPYPSGADLEISKTVDNPTPNENDTIVYEISVTNNGPETAKGITVTDILIGGITYVLTSTDKPSYFDHNKTDISITGTWTITGLAACESAILTIVATVDSGTAGTFITNTATVAAPDDPDQDPDKSNNAETVIIAVNGSNLVISKSVNNVTPDLFDLITYTIVITNEDTVEASEVVVSDVLPPGLTFSTATTTQGSYDTATGQWAVGNLPGETTATLLIQAQVNTCPADGSPIVNTAEIIGSPASAEATITVICADLAVTQTVYPTTAHDDDLVTYTITIRNNGPSTATNVLLTDILPREMKYVSHQDSGIVYDRLNHQWEMGDLAKGMSKPLNVIAQAKICGTDKVVTNTVEVNGGEIDPFLSNNQMSVNLEVLTNTLCNAYFPLIYKDYEFPICSAYFDDFSNPDSGWERDSEPPTKADYSTTEKKYFIQREKFGFRHVIAPVDYSNQYTVELDAQWGNIGYEYGIIFGQSGSQFPNYSFGIDPTRSRYRVLSNTSSTDWSCVTLSSDSCWLNTSTIFPNLAKNRLKVECDKTKAKLYINDTLLPPINISSCRGYLGVFAQSSPTDPNSIVYFDDFQINCFSETSSIRVMETITLSKPSVSIESDFRE